MALPIDFRWEGDLARIKGFDVPEAELLFLDLFEAHSRTSIFDIVNLQFWLGYYQLQ